MGGAARGAPVMRAVAPGRKGGSSGWERSSHLVGSGEGGSEEWEAAFLSPSSRSFVILGSSAKAGCLYTLLPTHGPAFAFGVSIGRL